MPLKFIILDNLSGISTPIDEPIGMDKISLHIRRDENYHGFLDAIDDSLGSFQFHGASYVILREAWETYGVDADVRLIIEFACADLNSDQLLYQGKFSFDQYKEIRGSSGCYVECAIQNGYNLQTFRSRINQKVSLDDLRCFDDHGISLQSYNQLGKEIRLNPKMVRFLDYATIDTTGNGSSTFTASYRNVDGSVTFSGTSPSLLGPSYRAFVSPDDRTTDTHNNEFILYQGGADWCVTPFTNIRSSEFGEFQGCVGDVYDNDIGGLSDCNEIFHYTPEIPYANNDIYIDIDISGALFIADQLQGDCGVGKVAVGLYKGLTWNDALSHNTEAYAPGKRACKLDYQELDLKLRDGTHGTNVLVKNDIIYNEPTATVDYCRFQYKSPLGNRYQFYPGEKLFLIFHIKKDIYRDMHLAFFSNNYTYRNTFYFTPGPAPRATDWSNPVPVTSDVITSCDGSPQSFVKITFDSQYKATNTPAYLINESLSRAVELTTNDALRVYSDYFGRAGDHPSLPYAPDVTGPAGLTCLTNGLLLRGSSPIQTWYMGTGQFHANSQSGTSYILDATNDHQSSMNSIVFMGNPSSITLTIPEDLTSNFPIGAQVVIEQTEDGIVTIVPATGVSLAVPGGSANTSGIGTQLLLTKVGDDSWLLSAHAPMFASFQEMIEALNCIHAVGFGLERDTIRTDHTDRFFVRVEPISYFYKDSLIAMTCDNVDTIETDASAGEAISVFKTGYSKWEAEEANGLDEFLSRREYRTTLNSLRKTLEKQCKYVASGYALEVTRRKLGTSTTDWRYDNDTFIICLTENTETGATTDFMSETNSLASGSTGLLDAPSVYNYRISPARNALRWLPYIVNSYADWTTGTLVFMSGDGNYTAQGLLASDPIEAYALNESATLSLDTLHDSSIRPIYRNEVVKFKYPMSYEQWKYINTDNNKYGKVRYSVNGGAYEEGYIKELKYDLYGGIAEFTLKPKIV